MKIFEETLNISFLMLTRAYKAIIFKLSLKIGPEFSSTASVLNLHADSILNPSGLRSQQELD